jgi:hypothetical protein
VKGENLWSSLTGCHRSPTHSCGVEVQSFHGTDLQERQGVHSLVRACLSCSKIAEAEAAVSVNAKKWLVMHVHVQLKLACRVVLPFLANRFTGTFHHLRLGSMLCHQLITFALV